MSELQRVGFRVRVGAAAVGLAVAGLVAACGGSSGNAGPVGASPSGANALTAYADCLRQHGVAITVPTTRPSGARPSGVRPTGVRPSGVRPSGGRGGGGGGGGFGGGFGFGNTPPSGVDQATWDAAQQACASVRPSFGGGGGRNNGAMVAYLNCLKDHGVTASTGPDLNTTDPKTAAAVAACAPLRPSFRPGPAPTAS
jgi:hypothetical protein